jgi:hypothetical protein
MLRTVLSTHRIDTAVLLTLVHSAWEALMSVSVDQQLAALSGRVRTWQLATVATLVIAVLSLGLAITTRRSSSEVRARAFVVVNDSGEELARLADERGGPRLKLRGSEANTEVVLGSFASDAVLAFISGGQVRVSLGMGREGFPSLSLSDKAGEHRFMAGLDENDVAAVVLWGKERRDKLVLRPERRSALRLVDENGAQVVSFPPAVGVSSKANGD